ncbi:chlorohydrolase [Streptococcus pneumoniae]|nr:chlorohydrolase [Streptococcus pneumoniae]
MKIKKQTRKLAAGCLKIHCFEVVDKTDKVSSKQVVYKTDEVSSKYSFEVLIVTKSAQNTLF